MGTGVLRREGLWRAVKESQREHGLSEVGTVGRVVGAGRVGHFGVCVGFECGHEGDGV